MTTGVFTFPLLTVVAMTFKLYAYFGKIPLTSTENVHCCCDLDRGRTDLVDT